MKNLSKHLGLATLLVAIVGMLMLTSSCSNEKAVNQESPVIEQTDALGQNTILDQLTADEIVKQAFDSLVTIDSEEDALTLINSYPQEIQDRIMERLNQGCPECPKPEPQSNHPAAQQVMREYSVIPEDIIAVQMMVWNPDSHDPDTVFAVVTDDQWFYVDQTYQSVSRSTPDSNTALTREIDVYGYYVHNVGSWWCPSSHWVVDFLMPVCFHELPEGSGKFDGILDAWAPDPPCGQYNGGWCAGYLCGSAWDGPGYQQWWNFQDCSPWWSRRVGKIVQKRWLFTWRNAGRSDTQIANSVRARVRY